MLVQPGRQGGGGARGPSWVQVRVSSGRGGPRCSRCMADPHMAGVQEVSLPSTVPQAVVLPETAPACLCDAALGREMATSPPPPHQGPS